MTEDVRYAVTIQEPWGTLIREHTKRIENRSWKPPAKVRGERFAIHTSKELDGNGMEPIITGRPPGEWEDSSDAARRIREWANRRSADPEGGAHLSEAMEWLNPGCIIATARLLGMVHKSGSGRYEEWVSPDEVSMYENFPEFHPWHPAQGGKAKDPPATGPRIVAQEIAAEDGAGTWPWWNGRDHAWILGDIRLVPEPVECRGSLRFWEISEDVRNRLQEQEA